MQVSFYLLTELNIITEHFVKRAVMYCICIHINERECISYNRHLKKKDREKKIVKKQDKRTDRDTTVPR